MDLAAIFHPRELSRDSRDRFNLKIGSKHFARAVFGSALASFVLTTLPLTAAPRGQYSYPDEKAIVMKEMRDSLDTIRHDVSNHEVEIRIIDEKLKNVDSMIENVRDQTNDFSKLHKDQLKSTSADLEGRISSAEAAIKGLIADLRQFQTHSNETTAALVRYDQKLGALQKMIDRQDQNIEHLQAAMRSLMEALQGKPQAASKSNPVSSKPGSLAAASSVALNSDRSYMVKSGDSLEKIARSHQTTIQAIKLANNLTSDRIVVGKTLIIPEK